MRWCRIETPEGPRFGAVDGPEGSETVSLVDGAPWGTAGGAPARTGETVPLAAAKLLVPVVPGTFYAIGSNYRDHVEKMAELRGRAPVWYERPRVGYRANSALIAHNEAIVKPADSTDAFQYEAELVAVIGKTGRNLAPEAAKDLIFGWTIGNDVSERAWQESDPTNIRAKNADTFKPMGPVILEGNDMAGMRTRVRLNGESVHDFDTSAMIFDAAEVISEISRYNTLSPGDVVWLGTDELPRNVRPGDEIEIEITGIGVLRNRVAERT